MILANHGILSSSGASVDADALAFMTAASITDNTQKTAINTLVTDLKTYNIWTKMKALYPFVGGSASSHKWNLKDPRDLDAAYRLVFSGGWTHSSTGALPNGTTAYADTKLNQNTVLQANNEHFAVYLRTNSLGTTVDGGLWNGTYGTQIFSRANVPVLSANDIFLAYGQQAAVVYSYVTNTDSKGFYMVNRVSSSDVKIIKNSSINNFSIAGAGKAELNFLLAARNNMGTADLFSNREQAFSSIGDSLTDTETSNLYTAIQNFNTTLSRNV